MPVQIEYAMPTPTYGQKVGAGIAILLAGLGLTVLGGCFLVGVMLMSANGFNNTTPPQPLNSSELVLLYILYVLAFISFVGAVFIFLAGIRSLLRVMRS
jgi:hypothetical protein